MSRFLTLKEAAEIIGMKPDEVVELVQADVLAGYKYAGGTIFEPQDVTRFVRSVEGV